MGVPQGTGERFLNFVSKMMGRGVSSDTAKRKAVSGSLESEAKWRKKKKTRKVKSK